MAKAIGEWWISWDKTKHTLTWFYGKVEQVPRHPIGFIGIEKYARRNFCLVFPRIREREWEYLMKLRYKTNQNLVRPELVFSDKIFLEITEMVFKKALRTKVLLCQAIQKQTPHITRYTYLASMGKS